MDFWELVGSSPSSFGAIAIAGVSYLLYMFHFKPKMEELDKLKEQVEAQEKSELAAILEKVAKIETILNASEDTHKSILSSLATVAAEIHKSLDIIQHSDKNSNELIETISSTRRAIDKALAEIGDDMSRVIKSVDRSPAMDATLVSRIHETLSVLNSRIAALYMSNNSQPMMMGERGGVIK